MKNLFILFLLAILTGSIAFYHGKNYSNIKIEFDKLRPTKEKINIYYNGFKIGYSKKIAPCALSNKVCVDVKIKKKEMFLPRNIEAKMKQKKINERKHEDYIEIIYPKTPSYLELSENMIIKGELASGFHNYLNEEVSYLEMEKIKLDFINTAENLQKATSILVDILYSLNNMAKSSEKDVEDASRYIKSSMKNINSITSKIDYSIDSEIIKSILENLDYTTDNLNHSTNSLKTFTGDIEKSNSISKVDSIIKNADEIVQGINCALKKRFSGIRLLFGKTIK